MGWALWQRTQSSLYHQWRSHWPSASSSFWWDAGCCTNFWRDTESDSAKQWQSTLCRLHPCWSLLRWWHSPDRETPPAVPAHLAAWDSSTRLLSSIFTSARETAGAVTIDMESPWCPSQASPWLDRLTVHLERGLLPESQCGFRKEGGTTDKVFAARLHQERCQEQNVDLYSTYVNDTVRWLLENHGTVWMLLKIHRHCRTASWWYADSSRQQWDIPAIPCPKQSEERVNPCLSPLQAQHYVFCHAEGRFQRYWCRHQHELPHRRFCLQSQEVSGTSQGHRTSDTFNDFQFADDCTLNAASAADMQQNVDKFDEACNNFGLIISIKKAEVMH